MIKISKRHIIVGFVIVIVLIGSVLCYQLFRSPIISGGEPILKERSKGPTDAPISITEFSDFQCPSCAYSQGPLKKILDQFPNLIRLQFRHFPLAMHRIAFDAAKSAECAGEQKKFWEYHDLLFEEQPIWSKDPDPKTLFHAYSNAAGLERRGFTACVERPNIESRIQDDKQLGESLQVNSTPTFFINGERFVGSKQLETKGAVFIKSALEKLVTNKGKS